MQQKRSLSEVKTGRGDGWTQLEECREETVRNASQVTVLRMAQINSAPAGI